MTDPQRPATGPSAALNGFFEGMLMTLIGLGVVVLLTTFLNRDQPFPLDWHRAAFLALMVGVVFALGRGLTGYLWGAMAGGIAGVFLGSWVSMYLPAWDVPVPDLTGGASKEGKLFALRGPTLDGKTLDVADYKGKVVLVDFWATWCVPCVHEMPTVAAAYKKYHDQGFEVVGVSLDDKRERLEAFLKENDLPWPQVFFDEPSKTGWQNPLAREHGIDGIPATFLLDREGRVYRKNLRGGELALALGPLFGEGGNTFPVTLYLCVGLAAVALAAVGALVQRRMLDKATNAVQP